MANLNYRGQQGGGGQRSTAALTAPYNFIPRNKQVVRPFWAVQINHDTPVQEELSGYLEFQLEAVSPIYVRQSKPRSSPQTTTFSASPSGAFFIPGSSIKGAIRNVLEIMSFGNLHDKTTVKDARDLLRSHKKTTGSDLSECIFGFVDKANALKGRVIFSHAFCTGNPKVLEEKKVVLASPHPEFLPSYIYQEGSPVNPYMDYQYPNAEMAGWKRYPVRRGDVITPNIRRGEDKDSITSFSAIEGGKDTIFKGRVRFHNLNIIEFGALLSALTFHGSKDSLHSIGMAKPLGYGRVKIIPGVLSLHGETSITLKDYLEAFEAYMSGALGLKEQGWVRSEQMQHLAAMTQTHQNDDDSHLKYASGPVKKEGLALKRYPEYLDSAIKLFPSQFKETELTAHVCYNLGLAERQRSVAFSDWKQGAIKKLERLKDNAIKEEEAQKQLQLAPTLSELSIGSIVPAQVKAISGNSIEVRLLVNSPEPQIAKLTANSIRKAERTVGRAITLQEGITIQVSLTETDGAGSFKTVAFVSL